MVVNIIIIGTDVKNQENFWRDAAEETDKVKRIDNGEKKFGHRKMLRYLKPVDYQCHLLTCTKIRLSHIS